MSSALRGHCCSNVHTNMMADVNDSLCRCSRGVMGGHPSTCSLKAVVWEWGSPLHPTLPLFPDICILCDFIL